VVSLVFTFEITRSLGMTEQDGSLLEKGRRQKKHVAAMMKRFRELCVEDPDFEYSTEREMRARMERNPHFASLSLSQRIATMVEEMEFHNMIEVHEEADNDALSEHLA
jgi:hypothetical protein